MLTDKEGGWFKDQDKSYWRYAWRSLRKIERLGAKEKITNLYILGNRFVSYQLVIIL